jgi:gliding motility-associated-like protein
MKNKYFFLFIFLLCNINIWAKHIIGGVISYEHTGNGNYKFVMRIYRDCNGAGAPFDGEGGGEGAIIGIHKSIGTNSFGTIKHLPVPLKEKKGVAPPSYPCMTLPPNICVEEGIYEFEFQIPDFPSKSAYHIVYQRCCRNNTITNIVAPQNAGATYEIIITPEAQLLGNNSPVFKNFPPTIICGSTPITFDHSATDVDGDSLYYRFCSPFYGGGPQTNDTGLNDCKTGARPNPTCIPPYDTLIFKLPYSSRNPLGANSMKIDGKTGILSGEVKQLGQYVVGICVEEYRKGKLIGKVFRDFQFNIALCDVLVRAAIASDTIVAQRLVINSCGSSKVKFDNKSTDKSIIKAYEWEFNINGQIQGSKQETPEITFPGLGKYLGRLIANPGLKPCTDTAYFEVNIFPGLEADFKYVYDTCVAGPVQFTDLSSTQGSTLKSWRWDYRDGNIGSVANPSHVYKKPNTYDVKLTVQDNNNCKASKIRTIKYFPVPGLIIVNPDTGRGCQPLTLRFNNLSTPIDETYTFDWDLGDGTKSNKLSPVHTYKDIGIYSVKLNLTSPIGCKTSASFNNLIEVRGSPTAVFSFTPDRLSNFQNTATFSDQSLNAVKWSWQFGKGEGSSAARNPIYTFRDTGVHQIRLIVAHPSGCLDTMLQTIDIEPITTYFLPNAFTPNFDGINDEFKGTGNYFGMNDFKMGIWNRWGEKVFETSDPKQGWNGQINNSGTMATEGVYVYYATFVGPRNKLFTFKGTVTLLQ